MTPVQRVSGSGSPFSGRDRAIALGLAIGILAAIAKPWGADSDRAGASPTPAPTAAASPSPAELAGHAFDPKLFGPFEPAPGWSVWPAGYFVSVQYVSRQANDRSATAPSTGPSRASPSPSTAGQNPAASLAVAGPDWPAEVLVGPGDHLLWLGVDTPLGWTITAATLRRVGPGGRLVMVQISRLPSDWDDHFAVLGIPVPNSSDRLTAWPAGTYRLDVTVDPGNITRTIRISILTAPDGVPAPTATTRP